MTPTLASRPYRTAEDLGLMQRLVQESWRQGKPRVAPHIGDLDWWMWQFEDPDPTNEIGLWFDRDELVGWAWLTPPASLDYHLHPDRPDGLLGQMLGWFAECSEEGDHDSERSVWALEHDVEDVAVLKDHGFRKTEQHFGHTLCPLEKEPPAPVLPDGFIVRPVRGEEELEARVAVHRAAFAPSRVTEQSYLNVMRSNTYRPELDMVVVAPDGTFAAFCLCWFDKENGVGEFEPVGTHPNYQRRGLARAVCLAALRQLRALGGDAAIVLQTGRDEAAERLYTALGFREVTKIWRFAAPMPQAVTGRLGEDR